MDGGATESARGGPATGVGGLEGWRHATSSGVAVWCIVLFGSILLNATLLLAFLRRSGLRTISNRFVMNLTASNLLTCAVLAPLLMLDTFSSSSDYTRSLCALSEGATALVTASSILSVLLIAVDQYFAVVDPLRYRTRIDKLKCGILMIGIWVVSVLFGLLAAFNPDPRSLWLVCGRKTNAYRARNLGIDSALDLTIDSTIVVGNGTSGEDYDLERELTIKGTNEGGFSSEFLETREGETNLRIDENSTTFLGTTFLETFDGAFNASVTGESLDYDGYRLTYGLAYSVFYALVAYLLPFVGVCWIYVCIYSAAHKNSERARRTGSGPMLSSASFCEEYCPTGRQEFTAEDFRRIPKISSLSSIDESIETSSPGQQMPRRKSEVLFTSPAIEEEEEGRSSAVVFTVGSQKVDVTPQRSEAKDNDTVKVPIAILRAEFLGKKDEVRATLEEQRRQHEEEEEEEEEEDGQQQQQQQQQQRQFVKSKFHDRHDDHRKSSSHDVMYEEMLRRDLGNLRLPENERGTVDSSEEGSGGEEEEVEDGEEGEDEDEDDEETLTFSRNRRLGELPRMHSRGLEDHPTTAGLLDGASSAVQETNLNFEGPATVLLAEGEPTNAKFLATVQNSHRILGNGILSTAAIDHHNSIHKSKQNGHHQHYNHNHQQQHQQHFIAARSTGRLLSGTHQHENTPPEESHPKVSIGNTYLEVDPSGSLLGAPAHGPMVTITPPNKTSLHRVSSTKSTSSYINSLKYRISNASLFKYREETRAARISALVIVMGLICWTPYVVVLILRNLPMYENEENLSHKYDVLALSLLILAAYVTPLLFGYRSRRVKRELRKIFCFKKELSYKNNRSLMAKKVLKRRHSSNLSQLEMDTKYNIFNCVYGRNRWPKDKVQFMQVPETALAVETCRSSFSSGASTQISTTSTEEC